MRQQLRNFFGCTRLICRYAKTTRGSLDWLKPAGSSTSSFATCTISLRTRFTLKHLVGAAAILLYIPHILYIYHIISYIPYTLSYTPYTISYTYTIYLILHIYHIIYPIPYLIPLPHNPLLPLHYRAKITTSIASSVALVQTMHS